MLQATEVAARELEAAWVVLETHTQLAAARAMYEAHGYQETTPYNDPPIIPTNVWINQPDDHAAAQ